jgi:hypothetical protein
MGFLQLFSDPYLPGDCPVAGEIIEWIPQAGTSCVAGQARQFRIIDEYP